MQSHGYAQPVGYARSAVESRARGNPRPNKTPVFGVRAVHRHEIARVTAGFAAALAPALTGNWLLVLGGFMVASWLGSHVAHTAQSPVAQYAALGGFVFAEALVFMPLLWVANAMFPGAIQSAAIVTFIGFGGLTAVAFTTRKDFSFLGGLLRWGGIVALVLIGASLIFGFSLGVFFSVAMVAFAGAAILYDTSNVLRHFPQDRHVAAALQLFSSVALMFWYILRIFMSSRD